MQESIFQLLIEYKPEIHEGLFVTILDGQGGGKKKI